jgi:ribosomal protein L37AE/L43A
MLTFHPLPPKQCQKCGEEIVEQRESYLYECEKCMSQQEE